MSSSNEKPELAAGDAVLTMRGRNGSITKHTIERVTATQIVLDNGDRFRKKDFHEVGESQRWFSARLIPVDTEEGKRLIVQARKDRARSRTLSAAEEFRRKDDLAALDALIAAATAYREKLVAE